MTVHTILVLVLSALCLGGALATEEEMCNPLMEKCAAVSGEALLQKNFKQSRLWSADLDVEVGDDSQTQSSDMPAVDMAEHLASSSPRQGLQSGYQGSPHCVPSDVESSQMQNQLLRVTTGVKLVSGRQAGGADAPLDSEGFRDTTAMCCPIEMEMFFNRLLDSLDLDVCSKPHVQGLMHWFICVPNMDFGYVLDVITNGNPCKYWAPRGEVCPTLVGSCAGRWCGVTTTTPTTTTMLGHTTTTPGHTTTTTGHRPPTPSTTTMLGHTTPTPTHRPPTPSTTTMLGHTTPTPTTTTMLGCAGKKDVVMAIDASKSVKNEGWNAEVVFAKRLIEGLTADGNPNGQRLSLHFFNKGTMPVGASGGKNSDGAFSTNPQSMLDGLSQLDYPTIREGGTDHPQVYMTAKAALGSPSSESKVLVMITDGETHKGTGCKDLDEGKVEEKIGKCSTQSSHVCAARGCDFEKCMCGVYNAALFKGAGYKLVIVGIPNRNHVTDTEFGIFNKVMGECASPGEFYLAENFEDLPSIVAPLINNLCQ